MYKELKKKTKKIIDKDQKKQIKICIMCTRMLAATGYISENSEFIIYGRIKEEIKNILK